MDTQNTPNVERERKKRIVGFFASYEHLAETVETTLPRGEMERAYQEYLKTEEYLEQGFRGFYSFLNTKGVRHKILNGVNRHQFDESILID